MTPHLVEQMLVSVCTGLLRVYQRTLSPDHGMVSALTPIRACRFEPTCSAYMIAALERFGLVHGIVLGFSRLFRCHPWSHGGYDPLPEKPRH